MRVLIFTGGDDTPYNRAHLPVHDYVIAADSGVSVAILAGVHVDLAVGDFDSLDAGDLASVRAQGTEIRSYSAAKDATDLEIALDAAEHMGAVAVTVVGGSGGRLDHLLANVFLLGADAYSAMHVEAIMGNTRVAVVRNEMSFMGFPGELASILPVYGEATGVTTSGLLYPLDNETLRPDSARGISNEIIGQFASVQVESGVLLVIRPGASGTHLATGIGPRLPVDSASDDVRRAQPALTDLDYNL